MIRKLKTCVLAFGVVLAFGALSAPAASAADFHSEAPHTIYDGAQPVAEDDVFTVNAGTIKCTSATYSGTESFHTGDSIYVSPTYSGCTAFGFVNAPIDTNGCTYRLIDFGSITIICGNPITVTAFNCHVSIGTQGVLGVTYDNAGSGKTRDVTATVNSSGLTYTQASKSFPGCTNGTFFNGTFKGSATITGTNTAGEQVGVWHS